MIELSEKESFQSLSSSGNKWLKFIIKYHDYTTFSRKHYIVASAVIFTMRVKSQNGTQIVLGAKAYDTF